VRQGIVEENRSAHVSKEAGDIEGPREEEKSIADQALECRASRRRSVDASGPSLHEDIGDTPDDAYSE
jgi:hypothetical protein